MNYKKKVIRSLDVKMKDGTTKKVTVKRKMHITPKRAKYTA